MKKSSGTRMKKAAALGALLAVLAAAAPGLAAGGRGGWMGGRPQQESGNASLAEKPTEIVESAVENAAASLAPDWEHARRIEMTDSENKVKISESGTYVITGACQEGSITVKKGLTGVVLALDGLSLSCGTDAPLSINKDAQVQIIISGDVTLTDNEKPESEAGKKSGGAYDGAAIHAKSGTQVYLTGSGSLTLNGEAKNGVKVSGGESSFIVDGAGLRLRITAANDGINSSGDLTLLQGEITVAAKDDALHADRILTVGRRADASGPVISVNATEGLEGAVVNIFGGSVSVESRDDAINGTGDDPSLTPAINITGGTVSVVSQADGLDCNGNINILSGALSISSASFGGEAGIDYDGALYIADAAVINNGSGISGPDAQGGGMDFGGGRPFGSPGDFASPENGSEAPPFDGRNPWDFGGHNGRDFGGPNGWMNPPSVPDASSSATPGQAETGN